MHSQKRFMMAVIHLLMVGFATYVVGSEIPEVANERVRNFLTTYDRSQAPPNGPVKAGVGIFVNELRLNKLESTMELVTYLRVGWKDERLKSLFTEEDKNKESMMLQIEVTAHQYFWKPDLFFRNHRASDERESLTKESFFGIDRKGYVYYVCTHMTTFNCPGISREYYSDLPRITCSVMIESYTMTENDMKLDFLDPAIQMHNSIELQDFDFVETKLDDCSENSTYGRVFRCIEVDFVFERKHVRDYVGGTMCVLSLVMVLTAWGGLWLDGIKHMTKRLALSLGTTLVLLVELGGTATWYEELNLMGNQTQVWLAFCSLLVSTTAMELVIAHIVIPMSIAKIRGTPRRDPIQVTSDGQELDKAEGNLGRVIDVVCGVILYPLIFLIFILVFFL